MDELNEFIPVKDLQYIISEYLAPCKELLHDEINDLYLINGRIPLWKVF